MGTRPPLDGGGRRTQMPDSDVVRDVFTTTLVAIAGRKLLLLLLVLNGTFLVRVPSQPRVVLKMDGFAVVVGIAGLMHLLVLAVHRCSECTFARVWFVVEHVQHLPACPLRR